MLIWNGCIEMKVFLVNDTDGEGDVYFAASTHEKAWGWIKSKQFDDILRKRKHGWTEYQLKVATQYFEDPKELHPYAIQEMELDVGE
jgi:hypothetical protein